VLGRLPAGTLYLRLDAADVTLRNTPVTLWRGEAGRAGGRPALKLVFADESMLHLSDVRTSELDAQGRAVIAFGGGRATLGVRPW